jgi:hypothetical protein
MIVYFYWNGLTLLSVSFFNSEIYFCRYFILFTSLVLIRGVTNTRITQLYSYESYGSVNSHGLWACANILTPKTGTDQIRNTIALFWYS